MIKNLHVENYKSLKNLDLELGRRNLVVGPNMSGKSNLLDCFKFLTQMCISGNLNTNVVDKHILEQAGDLHAEFALIHPFADGNGRIGRLLLSILTMKNGYCPVIIPPIRRAEYITAMQKSNKRDLNTLRAFVVSVIYEEMKSLKRLFESLVG